MGQRLAQRVRLCALGVLVFLAGCGGGGSDPAPPAAAPATVGVDGGTVSAEGAKLVIPAGAMTADTTIRIAKDSTGAPSLPQWAQAAGDMLAITPHGSEFSEPVTVRLPVPNVTLQANQKLFIAKAQPGGEWEVLGDTVQSDGLLEVQVQSFSFFTAVIVTFLPPTGPLADFVAFEVSSLTLECDGVPCADPELVRPMTITATVTNNTGQLPAHCGEPQIVLLSNGGNIPGQRIAAVPGVVVRHDFAMPRLISQMINQGGLSVRAALRCTDAATQLVSDLSSRTARIPLFAGSVEHKAATVVQFPVQLIQALGDTPTLRAVLTGGAANLVTAFSNPVVLNAPTASDEAEVFLERLGAADTAWSTLATSRQSAANPSPYSATAPAWLYWSFDYTLAPVTVADVGAAYRLRTCYKVPNAPKQQPLCAVGPAARMTVLQHTIAPSYTLQPQSMLVTPGQTASFSVVAGGAPLPTLQWQTRPANSTGDWANVSPSSSATTANYTTPAIDLADNGVQYRVLATNSAGSTASHEVSVSVVARAERPSIVSQPVSLSVVAGSEAVLAVSARGTGALSYQWYRRATVGKGETRIVGANSAQLKISNATVGDAGNYVVSVSNSIDGIQSNVVTITVLDGSASTSIAPSIVTQPAALTVAEGNVATFAVGVSGSDPLSFQWRKNGVDIAGATAAAYTLRAGVASDAGSYSVFVANTTGSVTSQAAALTVSGAQAASPTAPTIVTQPGTLVVAPGMGAMFGAGVQGSGPLSYEWLRDGAVVAGQSSAIYTIASVSALDAGTYQVRVTNSAGSVTSATSQLILLGAPAITGQPVAIAVTEGATASFGTSASGDALRYQWTRNGVAIAGADGASHTTPATTPADSGAVYAVIVYNSAGLVFSQSVVLTVRPPATPPPIIPTATGKIAAGPFHTCAVTADATAACWGHGSSGEVLPGSTSDQWTPQVIPGLSGVTQVAVGYQESCAIHGAGTLSCWGAGKLVPTPIKDDNGNDYTGVKAVILGYAHRCFIDANTTVRCWGDNSVGQLGQGSTSTTYVTTPVFVNRYNNASLTGVVSLVTGDHYTCALIDSGDAVCWGNGTTIAAQPAVTGATAIGSGSGHVCAVMAAGGMKCWGANGNAQLGNRNTVDQPAPVDVVDLAGLLNGVTVVAAQSGNTCVVPATGRVVCWGAVAPNSVNGINTFGPTEKGSLAKRVTALSSGWAHTCALVEDGSVECWGSNQFGQLGLAHLAAINTGGPVPPSTSVSGGAVFWK